MLNWDKNTIVRLLIIIFLLLIGIALDFNRNKNMASKQQILSKELSIEKNIEIIESNRKDVTGNGVQDKILLTGVRPDKSSQFFDNLTVVVKTGADKEYIKATYENFSGYEPELLFKDFSGDQVADIMVKAPTGGSGGIVNHLIATFKSGKSKVIFANDENRGVEVTGQFLPDFKAKLEFKNIDQEARLDLCFNREQYIRHKIYNQQGKMVQRKLIRPYSYPYGKLEAIDYNSDGKYELRGYQKIVGSNGADKISEVESIWSYQDEEWQLQELQYSNYLLKY